MDKDDIEIEKFNIIMVGSMGMGKILLVCIIVKLLYVLFIIVDVIVLIEVGYVGEDIESFLICLF